MTRGLRRMGGQQGQRSAAPTVPWWPASSSDEQGQTDERKNIIGNEEKALTNQV